MQEERMQILRMLEEGKVNSEEAARLLDALGDTRLHELHTVALDGRESVERECAQHRGALDGGGLQLLGWNDPVDKAHLQQVLRRVKVAALRDQARDA